MATFAKSFLGTTLVAASNGTVTTARKGGTLFKRGGTQIKKAPVKKAVKKKVAPKKGTQQLKKAPAKKKAVKKGVARKKSSNFGPNRPLWYPMRNGPPAWLDGTMIGDRGFDPLGLGKPAEYLQFDLDELDQSGAKNPAGGVIGRYIPDNTTVTEETLQPYNEVFDINRFRECELIHGRWCMVATLGALVAEAATGVSWVDAGKVELEGANYLGFPIPYSLTQLVALEVLLVGYIEIARSSELDNTKRCYPGGRFDPFSLASGENEANADNLKLAELKHGRLAMVAFLGFALEAAFLDGASPLEVAGF